MMYANKVAVALKHNEKVLRETKDGKVKIPFGSEYTILIKNLNSVRAQVTVSIDDTDVGSGTKFIIDPNDSVELERFIKNGNLKKGNRFKFIERTGNIEEHRGIGVEDGLIRVEFQFEKNPGILNLLNEYKKWENPRGGAQYTTCSNVSGALRGGDPIGSNSVCDSWNITQESEANEAGITVPGSVSEQEFRTVSSFPVESETHVIILQMLGETEDNRRVRKAVTVKSKPKCSTCGRTNKANAKFCSECGTALEII